MDPSSKFKYLTLGEESFFGEMSLIFDEPNEFGYFYDPFDRPVMALFIKQEDFKAICAENLGEANFLKRIA